MRPTLLALSWIAISLPAAGGDPGLESGPPGRPVMTLQASGDRKPPSSRALVDARAELQRRYRESLFRADTAAGAERAAELFLEAGAAESDRALKWLLLDEARRLGTASGNAAAIHRAVALASATYDFDELDVEYRALAEIPLRGLSPERAAGVADEAEAVARLFERGVGEIVLKRGAAGATAFLRDGGRVDAAAFAVEEVDPTGAGDCFGGAYVAARRLGLPVAACLTYGCAAGARNVTRRGPMEGAGTRAELDAFIAATPRR